MGNHLYNQAQLIKLQEYHYNFLYVFFVFLQTVQKAVADVPEGISRPVTYGYLVYQLFKVKVEQN